jgi:hypothetical protein
MWQVDWTPPEGLPGWPISEDEDDVTGAADEERETREAYLAQRTAEAVGGSRDSRREHPTTTPSTAARDLFPSRGPGTTAAEREPSIRSSRDSGRRSETRHRGHIGRSSRGSGSESSSSGEEVAYELRRRSRGSRTDH